MAGNGLFEVCWVVCWAKKEREKEQCATSGIQTIHSGREAEEGEKREKRQRETTQTHTGREAQTKARKWKRKELLVIFLYKIERNCRERNRTKL